MVHGEIRRQGYYSFAQGEQFTITNLMLQIGELPAQANDSEVRVIREDEDGIEHEYRVNVRKILEEKNPNTDFPLQPGDRIIVPRRRGATETGP